MDGDNMSGTTLNLEYKRFVRQVSNGTARTKYSYQAMQTDLLSALKVAPWRPAGCLNNEVSTVTNKVTETDRAVDEEGVELSKPTYTVYLRDRYDAFKQGGDAVVDDATFCGYAGMAAYRYKLPADYEQNIASVSMRFSAARYLRSGLRVALVLSDSAMPDASWSAIRGEGAGAIVSHSTASEAEGVKSWGLIGQDSVGTLLQSQAREGVLTFSATDFPALATSTRFTYLWVYVSIEDYEDWWDQYDYGTPRYYSIEGSATLVGGSLAVTFAAAVESESVEWIAATLPVNSGIVPDGVNSVSSISGWKERWGNFVEGLQTSNLYLPKINGSLESCAAQLARFGDFPRMDAFSFGGIMNGEVLADKVPTTELGIFAASRNTFTWSGSPGSYTPSEVPNFSIVSAAVSTRQTSTSTDYSADGANKFARLTLKFITRVIPPGKGQYGSVRITGSPNCDEMGVGINIWRTKSPDIAGPFGLAIASALGSHQELFTAKQSTVSATITGNGTDSANIQLSITADLVGYVSMPSGNGAQEKTFSADLTSPVRPGEVLILAPRIEEVGYKSNPFAEISPHLELA